MKPCPIRITIQLSLAAGLLFSHALPMSTMQGMALAQVDPNFQQNIQKNTVCSFIVMQDVGGTVRVRQSPSTDAAVVTMLKRGDGVRAVRREGNWVLLAARTQGIVPNETFVPLTGWVSNQFINGCSEDQFERWRR